MALARTTTTLLLLALAAAFTACKPRDVPDPPASAARSATTTDAASSSAPAAALPSGRATTAAASATAGPEEVSLADYFACKPTRPEVLIRGKLVRRGQSFAQTKEEFLAPDAGASPWILDGHPEGCLSLPQGAAPVEGPAILRVKPFDCGRIPFVGCNTVEVLSVKGEK